MAVSRKKIKARHNRHKAALVKPKPKTKRPPIKARRKEAVSGRKRSIAKKISRRRFKKVTLQKPVKLEKQILGLQETFVEKTKFPPVELKAKAPAAVQDLPWGYGKDMIALQVRDPYWLYTYWEVINTTWDKLKERLGESFYSAKKILRVYDVSFINFNGNNAHKFFDIEVGINVNNWYIDTAGPGRSWCVDLGLRLHNGDFITIVRSNTVTTPLDGPSWITDEEWMIPEDMFARLYGMGFGLGQSSPIGRAWQERVKRELSSRALVSGGIGSSGSPARKKQ